EVQIMGQSYLLGCPDEGEAPLRDAVGRVDAAMCKIRDAGKVKARDRIAVLAALNLAFDVSDRAAPVFRSNISRTEMPVAVNDPSNGETDPRLSQLLQRLDVALAGDGRLL
ncbi:MAG: cell division protein ZapA, partial [Ramlibacter sp.]